MRKKLKMAETICGWLTVVCAAGFLVGVSFEATRKPAILIVLAALIAAAAVWEHLREEINLLEFKLRRTIPEQPLQATVIKRRAWHWYRVTGSKGGASMRRTGRISYYVTFDIQGHGEIELSVPADVYHVARTKGMVGELRCRNAVCIAFDPQ